jgi:hypothetical protein
MKAYQYQLNDGSHVTLDEAQNKELINIVRQGWKDQQACLINYKNYGVFIPTKEDFAAYRARRDALVTAIGNDAKTGLASKTVADLFNELHSHVVTLCKDTGRSSHGAENYLEELRRRLAAAPGREENNLIKVQEELAQAKGDLQKALDDLQNTLSAQQNARRREYETIERHALMVKEIAILEHRIKNAKAELPEEIMANGRAMQL